MQKSLLLRLDRGGCGRRVHAFSAGSASSADRHPGTRPEPRPAPPAPPAPPASTALSAAKSSSPLGWRR
ncbi:hypothetical protein HZH66_006252 [Vespula vulgaris]|uniref:Uncharacterized protein n=1 Tax=Vespula vulgaris TaxID=7454 RepID=A0A834N694_VESVU|nr:hypothetical protein HZH66_006252 [Vespula vulgaris]